MKHIPRGGISRTNKCHGDGNQVLYLCSWITDLTLTQNLSSSDHLMGSRRQWRLFPYLDYRFKDYSDWALQCFRKNHPLVMNEECGLKGNVKVRVPFAKTLRILDIKWGKVYWEIHIRSTMFERIELKPQSRGWGNSSFGKMLATEVMVPGFSPQN